MNKLREAEESKEVGPVLVSASMGYGKLVSKWNYLSLLSEEITDLTDGGKCNTCKLFDFMSGILVTGGHKIKVF